jgi:hypothetical protein
MYNPTLLSVTTPSIMRLEGKDPQLTGELAFPSVMRTERCFSSSGLLEMLPIYQFRLVILGVYGLAQGMTIAVHTPASCGTPMNTLFR